MAWRDALVRDPELKPPDVEMSEAVDAGRGERGTVVAADGMGKAVLTKMAAKLVLRGLLAGIEQPVAAEQVAAEVIDNGEGVAVTAVAHAELSLEVDGPHLVGSVL
jgi:hypothetical protein